VPIGSLKHYRYYDLKKTSAQQAIRPFSKTPHIGYSGY